MRLLSPLTPWWDSLLGAVVGFGVLYLIACRVERWNGRRGHQTVFCHWARAWYGEYVAHVVSCSCHWNGDWFYCLKRKVKVEKRRFHLDHPLLWPL